ncbi:MAG: lysylphosphatidylglycerol synthase domain-containing protein [Candidatus Acidiferrales bacterium]
MRRIEWLFLALGVVLFVALLDRVGWGTLLAEFRRMGWFFLLVLLVSAGRYVSRTLAWRYAFAPERELPSFLEMFQVRMAGDTLNYLSFFGPLIGEPAKAALMRREVPLAVGLAGAVLEAGAYALTSGFVMVAGLIPALIRVTLNEKTEQVGWLVASLLVLSWLGGRWLLRRRVRFLRRLLDLFSRTPLRAWVARRRQRLEKAEESFLDFYAQHTTRFRLIFLWDLAAQAFAMLEIFVILGGMGLWLGWVDVLILEALGKLISLMFFFVPARLGTDEGGQAVVFKLLEFGVARGVGLALVQRLRALVWSLGGLLFLARYAIRHSS